MRTLAEIRSFIIDMDGVLWEGDRPLPGLLAFFAALRASGRRFVLATNNAGRTPEQYTTKLAGMGVTVRNEEILTSAQACALFLARQAAPGARVFAIGESSVQQALAEQGFSLCGLYETDAAYVVCGLDRGLSWDKLATATLNIRAGAKFIGTNPDLTLPTERGLTHGNGAILAALEAASGAAPIIVGKPEPLMYQIAMERLGADPQTTAAIGDRLETDILGAIRAGIHSLLVLSGASRPDELAGSEIRPTWVMQGIAEVTEAL